MVPILVVAQIFWKISATSQCCADMGEMQEFQHSPCCTVLEFIDLLPQTVAMLLPAPTQGGVKIGLASKEGGGRTNRRPERCRW